MNSKILAILCVLFPILATTNARPVKDVDDKPVPRYMLRLYEQVTNGLNAGGCGYNTIRNIRNLGGAESCEEFNLRFNMSLITPTSDDEFISAVRIHLELTPESITSSYHQTHFRLYLPTSSDNTKGRLVNDVTQLTSTTKDVIFNVTQLTLDAQSMRNQFLTFVLHVNGEPPLPACPPGPQTFDAMLEVELSSTQVQCEEVQQRKKRDVNFPHQNPTANVCQRLPLAIRFQEIGWGDWVIEPQIYDAFVCAGGCPFPINDHLNASNHAVVQNLLHSMQPTDVPPVCCAPTKLAPMSMMYFDSEDTITLKVYQDMIVESCGCQ